MIDITNASDEEIGDTVEAFAAAVGSQAVELEEVSLERVLLAVDASNQGGAAEGFAKALALRHGARVLLLYAYEGARDAQRERYLTERAEALAQAGVELEPVPAPVHSEHGLRSFEQILQTCEQARCDLIVLPAPYLDDYDKLGEHSIGATLDVLICRSRTPLLVVRAPDSQPAKALSDALLPIVPCDALTTRAASWLLRIVLEDGSVELLTVGARERREAVADSAAPQLAGRAEGEIAATAPQEAAGLIAAVQRRAAQIGLRCRVSSVAGDRLEKTIEAAARCERVVVLAVPAHPGARAFALSVVRYSRNPVLIVGEPAARDPA